MAQPALFMAGLAAVELLRSRDPQLVAAAEAGGSSSSAGGSGSSTGGCVCAGLSLGEYTALVFAGALTFEEGLRVGGGVVWNKGRPQYASQLTTFVFTDWSFTCMSVLQGVTAVRGVHTSAHVSTHPRTAAIPCGGYCRWSRRVARPWRRRRPRAPARGRTAC
mgnify:CR=1 FL=1